jgi:hypothetical protein
VGLGMVKANWCERPIVQYHQASVFLVIAHRAETFPPCHCHSGPFLPRPLPCSQAPGLPKDTWEASHADPATNTVPKQDMPIGAPQVQHMQYQS